MEILKKQYKLVQESRKVMLDFCSEIKYDDLSKENENFNKSSILELLLHIANTYNFWLIQFASGSKIEYLKEDKIKSINDIKIAFEEVDRTVKSFLESHSVPAEQIEGEIFWLKKNMAYSVLQLFTHVITHEFHHKGQIMTMSRMRGYTPLDADVIRF